MVITETAFQAEERVVAELAQLGVNYLSRQSLAERRVRPPQIILADLIIQPSSRVRVALIALLLAKPGYAAYIPMALKRLDKEQAQILELFYSAAVCLQNKYAQVLRSFQGADWQALPDLFADELGLIGKTPQARLRKLALIHTQRTGIRLNWAGTYESAARHLLRRWELEEKWNR